MSTIINTRSPFYLKVSDKDLSSVKLQLYIWTGLHSERTNAYLRYTISKEQKLDELDRGTTSATTANKLVDSTQNFSSTVQVGSFIKNTTDNTTATVTAVDSNTTLSISSDIMASGDNNYATDTIWIDADITMFNAAGNIIQVSGQNIVTNTFLGIDGYGYFEDGVNPRTTTTPMVLQSNTSEVYYFDGQDIKIPIFAEALPLVTLTSSAGSNINWEAANDFWETNDSTWGSGSTPIQIADNGNTNQKIQYVIIEDTQLLADGDTVTFDTSVSGYTDKVVTLRKVEECKFSPLNIIFYNKFGALQNIWYFKKSFTDINIRSEKFKNNILDLENSGSTPSYALSKHQEKKFMANGRESLTVNSGYYPESYNEVVRQKMLAEQVWVDDITKVLPINLKSNSLRFKKSVNDKLITYTVQFDFAFDKINNIL